jgi:hypothetical protein
MAQNGLVPLMPHATAAWLVDNTALELSRRLPNFAACTSWKCRRWPMTWPAPNIPVAIPSVRAN